MNNFIIKHSRWFLIISSFFLQTHCKVERGLAFFNLPKIEIIINEIIPLSIYVKCMIVNGNEV